MRKVCNVKICKGSNRFQDVFRWSHHLRDRDISVKEGPRIWLYVLNRKPQWLSWSEGRDQSAVLQSFWIPSNNSMERDAKQLWLVLEGFCISKSNNVGVSYQWVIRFVAGEAAVELCGGGRRTHRSRILRWAFRLHQTGFEAFLGGRLFRYISLVAFKQKCIQNFVAQNWLWIDPALAAKWQKPCKKYHEAVAKPLCVPSDVSFRCLFLWDVFFRCLWSIQRSSPLTWSHLQQAL